MLVKAHHRFDVALILFPGALRPGALHGADAVPDDGDLADADHGAATWATATHRVDSRRARLAC